MKLISKQFKKSLNSSNMSSRKSLTFLYSKLKKSCKFILNNWNSVDIREQNKILK